MLNDMAWCCWCCFQMLLEGCCWLSALPGQLIQKVMGLDEPDGAPGVHDGGTFATRGFVIDVLSPWLIGVQQMSLGVWQQ
jgi:hypothetical protein